MQPAAAVNFAMIVVFKHSRLADLTSKVSLVIEYIVECDVFCAQLLLVSVWWDTL